MQARKAQIAYEFLMLFFFLTTLFTFWFIITAEAKTRIQEEQHNLHLQDLGLSLQDDFYTALYLPDGFSRNLTIPANLNGEPYDVTIMDSEGQYYFRLQAAGFQAEFTAPPIIINEQLRKEPGQNQLIKTGGKLALNP